LRKLGDQFKKPSILPGLPRFYERRLLVSSVFNLGCALSRRVVPKPLAKVYTEPAITSRLEIEERKRRPTSETIACGVSPAEHELVAKGARVGPVTNSFAKTT
jgi:hypothetical protein